MENEQIGIVQLEKVIKVINQCTDNFLFMYDLSDDTFLISEHAKKIFDFPFVKFDNALEEIIRITYPEDRTAFENDIELVRTGRKSEHNIELRWINRMGKPIWISSRGKLMPTSNPYTKILIGTIEITNEADKSDVLTGLSTETQLRSDFALTKTSSDTVSGFMLKIDVDNIGMINEQYGMRIGDMILSKVADCCKKISSGIAKAYKISGDEFIIMNLTGQSALMAQKLYDDLKRELSKSESTLGTDIVFTVSGGTVAFTNDNSHLEEFLRKLNYTLSVAKEHGRNSLVTFNANSYQNHLKNLNLQEKLRESIKNNFAGFELYYQPVIDAKNIYLDSDKTVLNVIGAEALLRWSHDDYGMLLPDDFIPLLERTGMIVPVGRWILKNAFGKCQEWNKVQKDFRMSVNISYIQVQKSDILSDINTALLTSRVNPQNITIELTESGYIDNAQALQELTESLAKMGLNVDIDDFGTGYSNLRYLQYLHASTLKLDYTFVHKAAHGNEGDSKVIKHITQMAHELNMQVCMEGVESEEDIQKLLEYEPDKFQGFHFGRPMDCANFREHYVRLDSNKDIYEKTKDYATTLEELTEEISSMADDEDDENSIENLPIL